MVAQAQSYTALFVFVAATLQMFGLVIAGLVQLVSNRRALPRRKASGVFGLCLADFIPGLGLWFIVFLLSVVFSDPPIT